MYVEIGVGLFLGALSWSFLEYCIHRWLGHYKKTRPNPFADEHIRHHSQGNYFSPTWKKLLTALGITIVATTPAVFLGGLYAGFAYGIGLATFYLYYEILHRLEHVFEGLGPYGRWARRHHFYHHFVNPKANHGVTSPFWDIVFGTYCKPSRITVPKKLQMCWLVDPSTGRLKNKLVPYYDLR